MSVIPPGQPLRINFFTSYVHEQGTYFRSHNLAVGLTQLGHSVTVFGCDLDSNAVARKEEREGVRYVIVPESWKPSVFSQFNHPGTVIRRWLGRYPACDISHLFQPFLGAAAAWSRCHAKARFYDWDDQWTDGLFAGPVRSWRERWPRFVTRILENRLPHWATHVTVVGDYLGRMARERGAAGVTNIANGYWPAAFPEQATARVELGLRSDAFYAGFMGRTTKEFEWCVDGVMALADRYPRLRLAVCGPRPEEITRFSAEARDRIDYLGQLTASATRDFAAALDVGLLPLDDTSFNRSRFPIKFCEHLATGKPLLISEIGEVGRLGREFGWAILAGTSREEWLKAFESAVERLTKRDFPPADPERFAKRMSWGGLSLQMVTVYRNSLARVTTRAT